MRKFTTGSWTWPLVCVMAPFAWFRSRINRDHRQSNALRPLDLTVSLTRRSPGLALVAAALANLGLWVLFGHRDRLTFLAHPQLWLVPAGLNALAAEQVHRGRLRPAQALVLCYAGLLLVYLPSTADLFLTGLGRGVPLPIALALLSVAGVLLGTLLRARDFLFLGVTSLSLDLFAQIWHAAVGRAQTWASGRRASCSARRS